jgi:hypothetical protein
MELFSVFSLAVDVSAYYCILEKECRRARIVGAENPWSVSSASTCQGQYRGPWLFPEQLRGFAGQGRIEYTWTILFA